MLSNYNIQSDANGKEAAALWLNKRIAHLERQCYGVGFSQRVRGYMREYDDTARTEGRDAAPKVTRAIDRKLHK